MLKTFIRRFFSNLLFFYRNLGYRIFVSMTLSILMAILDGFGLAMFLPLLELVNNPEGAGVGSMGNLQFIVTGMEAIGLKLNLPNVLGLLCLFFILKGLVTYVSKIYRVHVRLYFVREIRLRMLRSLGKITYNKFTTSDVGRIQNTMTGEVERLGGSFRAYFWTVEQLILVFVYMGFAFFVDAKFAVLVSIGGFITNLFYKQIYIRTKGASKDLTNTSHGFQSLVIQFVSNYKYLKATALLDKFSIKLKDSIVSIEETKKKMGIYDSLLNSSREPLLIIVVSAVILFQTQYLNTSLGPILVSLLFFYRALNSLMGMQVSYNEFLSTSGSMENMMNYQKDLESGYENCGMEVVSNFNSSLVLQGVSFRYGEHLVLKEIDLIINKKETIALIGPSGSGKTTLLNIMVGLLPITEGDFYIDGVNRRNIDIKSYQGLIGYITQEPVIFNDTIFNNVTFWSPKTESSINRFYQAIEKASIDSFINGLPSGSDTILGNNGINLSGGQKQRISIARELYKGVEILFLDEATSSLDSETEKSIQDNIESLKDNCTIIIVAHRLSTVRKVDRIALMEDGKIIEIGDYDYLIENSEIFRRMVYLQDF